MSEVNVIVGVGVSIQHNVVRDLKKVGNHWTNSIISEFPKPHLCTSLVVFNFRSMVYQ